MGVEDGWSRVRTGEGERGFIWGLVGWSLIEKEGQMMMVLTIGIGEMTDPFRWTVHLVATDPDPPTWPWQSLAAR